jgi:hypothetical protein
MGCSQLVRASTVLRGWEARPKPVIETVALVTRSGGPGKIENLRWPLDEFLRAMPCDERSSTTRRIGDFFYGLERRLVDGAHEARREAARIRVL